MDILLENLIKKQIQTSKVFNPSSSYASVRRLVVDWMCELCEVLKFQEETIHHAVAVFDLFLSKEDNMTQLKRVHSNRESGQIVQLVAVTCILISAKFYEKTYPAVDRLNEIINSPFSFDDFIQMEAFILEFTEWQLDFITSFDILQLLLAQGVLLNTD